VAEALVKAALLSGYLTLRVHEAAHGLLYAGGVLGAFSSHLGALPHPVLTAGELTPPDLLWQFAPLLASLADAMSTSAGGGLAVVLEPGRCRHSTRVH